MKILLLITKAEIGGAQAFVLNLAKGLKRAGKNVTVAFGEGDYLPQELLKYDISFIKLKSLKRSANPFTVLRFIRDLKVLIIKESFDLIHFNSTNTLPGVLVLKSLKNKKIKTVFTVHGLSVLDKNYKANLFIKKIFKLYFKFFLRFINKIVFVSDYNYVEAKKNKIVSQGNVIYNGLDLDDSYFINREAARKTLEEAINTSLKDAYLIGSIGRLAKAKNYQFLINNWQNIKSLRNNTKIVIIGEGSERVKYENLIRSNNLGKDIHLVGEIKDASKLLKAFDLFMLPSIYEGLSISLIETVLARVLSLASDVGGNREVLGEENCFILNSIEDLVSKLSGRINLSEHGDKFLIDKMIKEYVEIYEK